MEGYAEIKTLLQEGLAARKDKEKNWQRWTNVYRYASTVDPAHLHPDLETRIYMIRTYMQILLPSLYFKDPYVAVRPLLFDDEEAMKAASGMEAVINYYLSTPHIMRVKANARAAILDGLVRNAGYIETKWKYAEEEIPIKGEGDRLTYDTRVTDAPYMLRVSPWDEVHDPYSLEGLEGARWCGRRKWLPIKAVKANKAYNAAVRNKIDTPDRYSPRKAMFNMLASMGLKGLKDRTQRGMDTALDEEVDGLIQVWEVYDLKYDRFMAFTPGVDGFLLDHENPYSHLTKFPITELMFNYDPDSDQPASIVEFIIPQQRELNHINTRQHDSLRRFSRMLEVVEGTLVDEKQGMVDLERGGDGTILRVNAKDQIGEIALNTKNMDGWGALKMGEFSDAAYTIGIPPTQTSAGHPKFKSATEVAEISAAFDVRLDDLREQVADWYEAVVTNLGENIQAFQDDSKSVLIAGEPENVTPESLSTMRFKYEVQLSEGLPENEQKRLERFSAMYQMTKDEPLLDRRKILEEMLRAMGEHNPTYFMAVQEEEAPGNIPPFGMEGPMGGAGGAPGPEAGAMAMQGDPAQQMAMMGGQPAGMTQGMGGGEMEQIAALLGGAGGM